MMLFQGHGHEPSAAAEWKGPSPPLIAPKVYTQGLLFAHFTSSWARLPRLSPRGVKLSRCQQTFSDSSPVSASYVMVAERPRGVCHASASRHIATIPQYVLHHGPLLMMPCKGGLQNEAEALGSSNHSAGTLYEDRYPLKNCASITRGLERLPVKFIHIKPAPSPWDRACSWPTTNLGWDAHAAKRATESRRDLVGPPSTLHRCASTLFFCTPQLKHPQHHDATRSQHHPHDGQGHVMRPA